MQRQGRGDLPTHSYITPQQQQEQYQTIYHQGQQQQQQHQPYQPSIYVSNQTIYHQGQQQQTQPYQLMNQPYSHQQSMYMSNQTLYHRAQQLPPPYRPIMNQPYTHQQSIYQDTQNTQQFRTQATPNNIRQNALINVQPQQHSTIEYTDNKLRQVDNKSTQTSSPPMLESDALLNKIGQLTKENEALRKQNTGHTFTITQLETENAKLKKELDLQRSTFNKHLDNASKLYNHIVSM